MMRGQFTVSHDHPVLQHHRVFGRPTMPALAFVDLLYQLMREQGEDPMRLALRRMSIYQPLVIDEGQALSLLVTLDEMGPESWRVTVEGEISEGVRARYITAEMHRVEPATFDERVDLTAVKQDAECVELEQVYAGCRDQGVLHSGLMQLQGAVYTTESALWIELHLSPDAQAAAANVLFHPALIDAASLGSGVLFTADVEREGRLFLPLAVESFAAATLLRDHCWVRVARQSVRRQQQLFGRDIEFFDTSGQKVAQLTGFQCKLLRETPATAERPTAGAVPFLLALIADKLGKPVGQIRPDVGFYEMGLDSVGLLELVERIGQRYATSLPPTLLFEHTTVETLAAHLDTEYGGQRSPAVVSPRDSTPLLGPATDIAIIGMAGRYPGAEDLGQFWHNLKAGRDCITEVPASRWDPKLLAGQTSRTGKPLSHWGGFIDGHDCFDAQFFRITPREAEFIDPQERLYLEVCWEALEDAGYSPETVVAPRGPNQRRRVGVFVGVMHKDYTLVVAEELFKGRRVPLSLNTATIANRVSYFCNFHGPSMALDTLCSSSLTAIHMAIQSIRLGESEVALAGGVNLSLHPGKYLTYGLGNLFSTDGRCRAFGEGGDGYVSSEGVGVVLLKPLARAIEDRDAIYAVIKGSTINHVGAVSGVTVPSPVAQAEMIGECLSSSGVDPRTLSFVEAHGTGTSLGDPIEIEGLAKAFREHTTDVQFCAIGSVKSNIGHAESAAGVSGLTKVALQLHHQTLVRSLHSEETNPHIDFASSPFYVQQRTEHWESKDGAARRAGLSSFGATGSNAHLILEEYLPATRPTVVQVGTPRLVPISARSPERLLAYARKWLAFARAAGPVVDSDATEALQTGIRQALAGLLHVEPDEIDPDLDWQEYGLDPVRLARLLERVASNGTADPGAFTQCRTVRELAGAMARASSPEPEQLAGGALDLSELSFTLLEGRRAFEYRLAFVVRSLGELTRGLQAFIDQTGEGQLWVQGRSTQGAGPVENLDLPQLARAWTQGAEVDWRSLFPDGQPSRAHLPSYPFARERYWVPPASSQEDQFLPPVSPQQDQLRSPAPGPETLLLQPVWRDAQIETQTGPEVWDRRCLLLAGFSDEVGELTASRFEGASCQVLAGQSGQSDDLGEQFGASARQLFGQVQSLLSEVDTSATVLIQLLVHHAAQHQLYRGLFGLLQTAQQEAPRLACQLITDEAAEGPAALVERLDQNAQVGGGLQIRYRDGMRQLLGWEPVPAQDSGIEGPWKDGGVYLITGGAGALGMVFAHAIAQAAEDVVLILLGRSRLDSVRQAQLDALEACGARAVYHSLDIRNRESVDRLVRAVVEAAGRLDGVIHSAGLIQDNYILKKTSDEFEAVIWPKVAGAVNLDLATQELPLDLFVLFSSGAGALGNPGQADYATANAFLDRFAAYRNGLVAQGDRHGRTLSIGWPLWQDGGMQVDPATLRLWRDRLGLVPLPNDAGIRAFERCFLTGADHLLVLHGDPDKLSEELLARPPAQPRAGAPAGTALPAAQGGDTVHQLKRLLGRVIKMPVERIDAAAALEDYGIDSVMVTEINQLLEAVFGPLSKTLLFEYQTLNALAEHLDCHHPQTCARWGGQPGPAAATVTAASPRETDPSAIHADEPMAIIGITGRYPRARTLEAFWRNLVSGRDCISEVPPDRWPLDGFYEPDVERAIELRRSYSKWGGFLEGFAEFDPLFFKISPQAARTMDPQERLFLQACWSVIEDAGLTREQLAEQYGGRVGVFAGITKTGYELYGPQQSADGELTPHTSFSSVANRVSYMLDLHGPSMPVDTMCSSSLTAVHLACEHIRRGECELAMAGGVNLYLHPSSYIGLSQQRMLSPDGRCRTFGEGASGFVPGEGVGVVLIKRLSAAIADQDRIHAVIRATGVNHGGKTNGYTVPNPVAQRQLIEQTMARAGVDPRSVSYVEAHGTGTSLGDPIEITGLTQAFGSDRGSLGPCAIGSVKSNIGHLEAASGIAGLTKVVLQLQHRMLVPSLHAGRPNPNIDFGRTPFVVQQQTRPWEPSGPRIAGVSSFGAGGANAHVLIEEYLPQGQFKPAAPDTDRPALVVLSARTTEQLQAQASQLLTEVQHGRLSDENLGDAAYTLQVGREAMSVRLGLAVGSVEELSSQLEAFLAGRDPVALDGVLAQWSLGATVDWRARYSSQARPRPQLIGLPTYPFSRKRYWLPGCPVAKAPSTECLSYLPGWQAQQATTTAQWQAAQTALVVWSSIDDGLARATSAALRASAGRQVIDIAPDDRDALTDHEMPFDLVCFCSASPGESDGLRLHRLIGMLTQRQLTGPATQWYLLSRDESGVTGLGRAMAQSETGFAVRNLLVPSELTPPALLLEEPAAMRGELVKIEGGRRFQRVFRPLTGVTSPAGSPFRRGGVYVILGGSGTVGRILSQQLIERCEARVVWIGRRSAECAELTERLASVGHAGNRPCYFQADANAPEQLRLVINQIVERFGQIKGGVFAGLVMHFEDGVGRLSDEAFSEVHDLKLRGGAHFYQALERQPLDFLCYCSSIQAFGFADAAHSSAYAAGISACDAMVRRERAKAGFPLGIIHWGFWRASVAGTILERNSGVIEDQEGWDCFERFVGLLCERRVDELVCMRLSPQVAPRLTTGPVSVRCLPEPTAERLPAQFWEPLIRDAPEQAALQQQDPQALHGWVRRLLSVQLKKSGAQILDKYQRWLPEAMQIINSAGPVPDEPADQVWHDWEAQRPGFAGHPQWGAHLPILEACLRQLPDILAGRVRASDVVFPEASMERVAGVYQGNALSDYFNRALADIVAAHVGRLTDADSERTVRIIEVGAGTGGTSAMVFDRLQSFADRIEYTYTDVSQAFLNFARETYGPDRPYLSFSRWDVSRPGLPPQIELGGHDLLIATNVLHATPDIRETLRNAQSALCAGGLLLLNEIVQKALIGTVTFGLLDGWWAFRDPELRIPGSPLLTADSWQRVLREEGFGEARFTTEAAAYLGPQIIAAQSAGLVHQLSVAPSVSAPVHAARVRAAPSDPAVQAGSVEATITGHLSRALELPPTDIAQDAPFSDYGVDSIIGVALVKQLNRDLGLQMNTAVLYEQTTVERLARFIAQSGGVVTVDAMLTEQPAPKLEDPAVRPGDLAVVGLSGQFPDANDAEQFWHNLVSGHDPVRELAGAEGHRGGTLRNRAGFDPLFFNISPLEAESMHPHQSLVLQESWRALEDAGIDPKQLSGSRVGVFIGAEPVAVHQSSLTGSSDAIIASRLSYYLDLNGPALVVNTGCSSSAVAIHLACESLRSGESSLAIAGGVFASLDPEILAHLAGIGMVSPSGKCHTFDASADGTVLSEGVGIVVLKRAADAVADGDNVLGLVKASGVNQDGASNGITAPNGLAQEALVAGLYRRFDIDPEQISCLETHGTGTKLGDPVEANALVRAFGQFTDKRAYCVVGSAKASMGHASAAAGVIGLIKVLLSIKHRTLPGLAHFEQLNPLIEFEDSPFFINPVAAPWSPAGGGPRMAALNSFGHSGTNVHLVIAEYAEARQPAATTAADSPRLVPLSAKSEDRLRARAGQLLGALERPAAPSVGSHDLADIAHTLQLGREAMPVRVVFTVRSTADLVDVLTAYLAGEPAPTASGDAQLDRIARAWSSGEAVDWDQLYPSGRPRRVSLPGYPFGDQQHWTAIPQVGGAPTPSDTSEGGGPILMTPIWDVVSMVRSDRCDPLPDDHVVVIGGSVCQLAQIRRSCPQAKQLPVRVGESELPQRIDHVVWLGPESKVLSPSDEGWISQQEQCVLALFGWIARLLQQYGDRSLSLTVITTRAIPVASGQTVDPTQAALHGLAGSLAKEQPSWRIRLLDLAVDGWPDSDWLWLAPDRRGRAWAYREGEWYRQSLVPIKHTSHSGGYRQGGVYLVLGGAGDIGEAWTRYMVETYQAQVVWIGRRQEDATIRGKREAIGRLGPAPVYLAADATDREALALAVSETNARFGPVHGVVHSAVVFFEEALSEMTEASLRRALRVKVDICVRIAQVFDPATLDFVLFFSSVISQIKNPRQAHYAAGCAFKDAFALTLGQQWGCPVKTINWGYWSSTKTVVADPEAYQAYLRMAEIGIALIEPPEAMAALETLLAAPVAAAGLIKTTRAVEIEGLDRGLTIECLPPSNPDCSTWFEADAPDREKDVERVKAAAAGLGAVEQALAPLLLHQLEQLAPLDELTARGGVIELYRRWLEHSVTLLAAAEIAPDGQALANWQRDKLVWAEDAEVAAQVRLVDVMLDALPRILTGQVPATDVMFPDGSMALVEGVHKHNPVADFFNDVLVETVLAYVDARLAIDPDAQIRIIEIGAGTGGSSAALLRALRPLRDSIEQYHYTDLSQAFLNHAKREFGPDTPFLTFGLLDIEQPVVAGGVEAGSFDIALASNVVHATRSVRHTLRNAKALLKRSGLLLLNEVSTNALYTHLTFGLLEGWWLYDDAPVRIPGCPGVAPQTWSRLLRAAGFDQIGFPAEGAHCLGQQILVARSDGVVCQAAHVQPEQPLSRPGSVAGAAAPVAHTTQDSDAASGGERFKARVVSYLRQRIASTLKMPTLQLDPCTPLDQYGLDSIIAVTLAEALREDFDGVNSTLFFEFQTLDELADHFVVSHAQQLHGIRGTAPGPAPSVAAAAREKPKALSLPAVDEPIAVIGMSGRFAQAHDVGALWDILVQGQSAISEMPEDRWHNIHYYGNAESQSRDGKWGGYLPDMASFDPLFFEISPAEAALIDPRQRLFLEEAWHALEDAGYLGERVQGSSCGVYVGVEEGEYGYFTQGDSQITSNQNATLAARIAYKLDLKGPNLAVSAACSSGLVAVHQACQALRLGECEMALVGGVSLILSPIVHMGLERSEMLAPDGQCRVFDDAAQGMVPGDAVAVVVLKPLSQALAARDRVYGCITASGVNYDGRTTGLTVPNPASQAALIESVHARYGVDPAQIQYVLAHSVGSKWGDPIEVQALTRAFAGRTDQPCVLGSVKPQVGHSFAASGIVSLISMLMAIEQRTIPGTKGFEALNAEIDLGSSPLVIQAGNQPWTSRGPRVGAVGTRGISGTNAYAVVREYAAAERCAGPAPGPQVVLLSARSTDRLGLMVEQLLADLERRPGLELADVAYTLQVGRDDAAERLALVVSDLAGLIRGLGHCRDAQGHAFSTDAPVPVFTGRAADRQAGLSSLIGGQPGSVFIEALLAEADPEKLALFWCLGGRVPWERLPGTAEARRISLPGYPFQRERYWCAPPSHSASWAAGPRTTASLRDESVSEYLTRRVSEELEIPAEQIDPTRQLFDYGLDSMVWMRLIAGLQECFGISLSGRQMFAETSLEALVDRVNALVAQTPAPAPQTGPQTGPQTDPTAAGERVPLSEGQRGLWFLQRMFGQTGAYNVPLAFSIEQEIDPEALKRAFAFVLRQYPILGAVFGEQDGEPFCVIPTVPQLCFEQVQTGAASVADCIGQLKLAAKQPFSLETGPLMRILLLTSASGPHQLLITVHHLVFDGSSAVLLVRALSRAYAAYSESREPAPPVEGPVYADFVRWQSELCEGRTGQQHLAYWKQQLSGSLPPLLLPLDRVKSPGNPLAGETVRAELDADRHAQIRALSKERRLNLSVLFLGLFKVLLRRYTGQDDLLVGMPNHGRPRSRFESVVGYFVNPLAIRSQLDPEDSLTSYLNRLQFTILDGLDHAAYPFPALVRALNLSRSGGSSAVFGLMFSYQNFVRPSAREGLVGPQNPLGLTALPGIDQEGDIELALDVSEEQDRFVLALSYQPALFDRKTIDCMMVYYLRLLDQLLADPDQLDRPVSELSLLDGSEWAAMNAPELIGPDRPETPLLPQAFEAQVALTPDASALVSPDSPGPPLSYRSLNQRANRLAHLLIEHGAGPGTLVAHCLTRGPEAIVALLAILKSGGVYLPLDPQDSVPRLSGILTAAGVELLVTDDQLLDRLPDGLVELFGVVNPYRDRARIAGHSIENPPHVCTADRAAYVIHTSGSTGAPKGVVVSHGAIAQHCRVVTGLYGLCSIDRVLQFAPLHVDVSLEQLLPALTCGACVVLRGDAAWSAAEFTKRIESTRLSVIDVPPAYLRELLEVRVAEEATMPDRLRLVIVGGDVLEPETVRAYHRSRMAQVRLVNAYGPTETTVTCMSYDVSASGVRDRQRVPVGRPLPETVSFILDRDDRPVPDGIPGELHIGGDRVALGYLNRPDLTEQVFIANPASELARVYRTGDLARRIPGTGGLIEFLGRIDNQVKIRGYRVELGEVESCLSAQSGVRDCAVIERDGRLVAYVVCDELTASDLGDQLAEALPPQMRPSAYALLDRLPRTSSGKIDRQALPLQTVQAAAERTFVSPRSDTERRLAEIWQTLLECPRVGVLDDFFELGGHSLLCVRMATRIQQVLGLALPLATLVRASTIAALARELDRRPDEEPSCLVCLREGSGSPPLFLVHPAGGTLLCYLELARHNGSQHPMYGLQAAGAGRPAPGSLERMAADYVEALVQVQPRGPYHLAGWSTGGVVAYEMAQQLVSAGQAVTLLGLIDSYTPRLSQQLEQRAGAGLHDGETELFRAHLALVDDYQPRPYPGQVTLFRALQSPDADRGWKQLAAGGLDVQSVQADHHSILKPPAVQVIADYLDQVGSFAEPIGP